MRDGSPFDGFFLGGFESSTMKFPDGRRVDVSLATGHAARAAEDYGLLAALGVRSVRDALAWHRIEEQPGRYDWSGFRAMQRAAREAGVQIVWDLCHYGWPDHLDFWSADFIPRFAGFAEAAARVLQAETDRVPVWVPVNEISYWAWAAGDCGDFEPAGADPHALKRRLVQASLAAMEAVRSVDPRARIMHPEPIIHIVGDPMIPGDAAPAEAYRRAMFQAWDMLSGRIDPELGGRPEHLDLIGVNYYPRNQWVHQGRPLRPGDPLYRPFADMLEEAWQRYRRPLVIAETGAEGADGPRWFTHVCEAVREAQARGIPIEGVCLYPAMDYPGWADGRHCRCGVIELDRGSAERRLDRAMVEALRREQAAFGSTLPVAMALAGD